MKWEEKREMKVRKRVGKSRRGIVAMWKTDRSENGSRYSEQPISFQLNKVNQGNTVNAARA
jgi:hypothetical protein